MPDNRFAGIVPTLDQNIRANCIYQPQRRVLIKNNHIIDAVKGRQQMRPFVLVDERSFLPLEPPDRGR